MLNRPQGFARVWLTIVMVAAPALAVENAPQVFSSEDRRGLEQGFHEAFRYHPIVAEPLEDPRALLAPDEAATIFRVIPESGSVSEERHRFTTLSEAAGNTHYEYHLNAAESQLVRLSDGQGVFIEGAIDRKEGVRTEFQPAKPLLPKGLLPGQSVTGVSKVRVLDLEHPDKVRHSGELTLTLTHLGSFHAIVPLGEYDAVLLRLESRGRIGPADIVHRQYYCFAEDTGLVAFLESRQISAFGIYEKREQQALVLIREDGSP